MKAAATYLLGLLILTVAACKKQPTVTDELKDLRNADKLNSKKISQMLDDGMSPNEFIGHKPLLNVAAGGGSAETVALLLKHGADVKNRSRGLGKTALFEAAYLGNLDVATLLLDAGADPNAEDDTGEISLREAALGKHLEMVRLLISRGADPKARNKKGEIVAEVVGKQTTTEILELLTAP